MELEGVFVEIVQWNGDAFEAQWRHDGSELMMVDAQAYT